MTDDIDDPALWAAFHDQTLPAAAWTHREHLRVAFLYMQRYALDEAHILMRVGIIRLNAAHGLVETPARGYHDTLTRAWLVLIAASRGDAPALAGSAGFIDAHASRLSRDAMLRHYSRERIFSPEARARFVEPDLAPLPVAPAPTDDRPRPRGE